MRLHFRLTHDFYLHLEVNFDLIAKFSNFFYSIILFLYSKIDDKDVHIFDMNDRGHRSVHKFTDYGCLSGTSIAVSNNSQFIATG